MKSELRWNPNYGRKPATEEEIRDVERLFGITFPETYLEILRQGDGMRPSFATLLKVDQTDKPDLFGLLTDFIPVRESGLIEARQTMLYHADDWEERDAHGLQWVFPIAGNGDGWVCLDYAGDPERVNCRMVNYWLSFSEDEAPNGTTFLAGSFDEMIAMIGPWSG